MIVTFQLLVGSAFVVVLVAALVFALFGRSTSTKRDLPDVAVILHQFSRGPEAPNMSPFCLKVETFLRINKIPYECDFKKPFSAKGKTPWIEYKGQAIPDSEFCIKHLKAELGIDMDAGLTPAQKGVALAFRRLLCDHYYFLGGASRYLRSAKKFSDRYTGFPKMITRYYIPHIWKKILHQQGIGRHSEEEQFELFMDDVNAVSHYLGDKAYFMGETISEIDLDVFCFLVQTVYHDYEGKGIAYVRENCNNLVRYVERLRTELWSDWPVENIPRSEIS